MYAGLIGGAFLSMASHGTDQLIVQRLMSSRSLKDAQRAIIGSGFVVFFQFFLFLCIGLGLWAASLSRSLDRERGRQAAVAAVLGDPAAHRFALSSGHGSLVVGSTGRAVLLVSGLEPPPSGKVYEAWVVQHGAPEPTGTFSSGQTATLLTTPVPEGAKVLVTQERAPGVDQPKGTPLTGTQA